MIHGNSNDPVLIKKIYLNIWTLRDELEAILKKKVKEKGSELTDEEIQAIKNEYILKTPKRSEKNTLSLIEGEGEIQDEVSENSKESGEGQEAQGDSPEEQSADSDSNSDSIEESSENAERSANIIQRDVYSIAPERISKGICILSEVGMLDFSFFCNRSFLEGQSIVIEFLIPTRFVINADIAYCRPFNMKSKIISENKLPFRIMARFTFLKEGERTLLRQFVQSIEPEIPAPPVIIKKPKEDEADDFDDLDGLDF